MSILGCRKSASDCRSRNDRQPVRTTMPRKPDYSVPALERGLDVLEALASQRRPLTLTEVARHCGHSANSLFRIADCLTKRGYLERDAAGAFRPTLHLFELAHAHSPVDALVRAAALPMDDLVAELGESCHVAVLNGSDLVIVAQSLANRRVRVSIEVGSRYPAVKTASGRLLLAHLDPDARLSLQKRSPADSPALTEAAIRRLQAEGHCVAYEDTVRGVLDVAVLIGNPEVGVMATLAVTALSSGNVDAFAKKALSALHAAAERIAGQLGLRSSR